MSAKIVSTYGMRPVGGFGIRGFRAHCAKCGYLSDCFPSIHQARYRCEKHDCKVVRHG